VAMILRGEVFFPPSGDVRDFLYNGQIRPLYCRLEKRQTMSCTRIQSSGDFLKKPLILYSCHYRKSFIRSFNRRKKLAELLSRESCQTIIMFIYRCEIWRQRKKKGAKQMESL
jgi:hypothetical protein